MQGYISIGVFIDGGYYAKVNRALKAIENSIIRVRSLFDYICSRLAVLEKVDPANCQITEAHYFRGRFRVKEAYDKHLREMGREGEKQVIEKGIDVWFALEAYELSTFRKFDYVVLITGDADHEMLVRKLKALKIKTVLLTWNLADVDATSPLLSEEAGHHWELSNLLEGNPELKKSLLYKLRDSALNPLGDEF